MGRMVGDLLDLTRTRLGAGIPIVPRDMDLGHVVEVVLAELEATHPERALPFQRHGDLRGVWDSDRLSQVLSNLVGNALDHGQKDAPVTIVADARGDHIELRVHNAGHIPERQQGSIFEPMVRHADDTTGDRKTSGIGLGLYIAREIVRAHGGTIGVVSTREDGTTFAVDLPRAVPSPGADRTSG